MSQISEILASAYTPEMETLGALPDIPTFDGEPVPVSRNPLTPGTRPLQLLPSPGTEFLVRYETNRMRGFQSEVWSYEYCIYSGGPSRDAPVESRRIPRYLAYCHHTYASGEDPEYWRSFLNDWELSDERKTHKTAAHYKVEAAAEVGAAAASAGPAGVVLGDVSFPPGMEVVLDPALGLGSGIVIPADLRQAPPPFNWTLSTLHMCRPRGIRRFASGSGLPDPTSDLEIGRLRRHQSRQSSAVSQIQAEVDRLRMRLEGEGIPLDSSEEDEDGSSSDDAPLSPPP
ncbi:hypothetical protein JCGZ_06930 [Jatropha curcas]|uniref:Aminotransferase-like plant mobile domain-containing protein n=1 Tax=Jatropha curcas TaxID=180498 RepID=A0A067KRP7_JATCU|nr:hypothetical protein JCGZ_06930 [Jatropha curcas]